MAHPLTWIDADAPLPPAESALLDPPGLVAVGTDLGVVRLTEAYRKGIFPWFSDGDPVLWWSPDPRMVLHTNELHVSKSLAKQLRQIAREQGNGQFNVVVTTDRAFSAVIEHCANRGQADSGTWITEPMKRAYRQWHQAGGVHSIETWIDGELAGGLYGVCLGRMFFGESMFSLAANASKIALVHLVRFLARHDVTLIDCQMQTEHLASLGARTVNRADFLTHVRNAVEQPAFVWPSGWIDASGQCHAEFPTATEPKLAANRQISYDQIP
jgi:leucyl/phenylalanyl-tRNA---protein transferase